MFRSAITRRSFVTTRRLADDKTITEKIADTVRNAAAALKEDGKIGKEFTPQGSVGGTMEEIGGPLSSKGAIGKQFTTDGAIGAAGQKVAESTENAAKDTKKNTP